MNISEERYQKMLEYAENKRSEIKTLEEKLHREILRTTPVSVISEQIDEVPKYKDMDIGTLEDAFNAGARITKYWDAAKPYDLKTQWYYYLMAL